MAAIEKIEEILARVAESENISNFEVVLDEKVLRGDGFLSEFHTGDVRDKDTGELIKIYIKVPPQYENEIKGDVYFNEYNVYAKIFPELDKFQREKGVKVPFDKIPKFYCGSTDPGNEYIALENLKVQNYDIHDKSKFINETHLRYVFETYGKYHALTFAFKDQNREKYEELVTPLKNIFGSFNNNEKLRDNIKEILQRAYETIKDTDEAKAARIKFLVDDMKTTASRGMAYEGKYSALIHGDCWSNNIMFKCNANGELQNIKLLDHQLARDSTPVHDLAYFFYAGAGKKDFDKLDDYLELYYKSFSSFARELGSDPEELFTLDILKYDWKVYGFLGIAMAFVVWPIKLMSKAKIEEFTNQKVSREGFRENMKQIINGDVFKNHVIDILLHAIDYNVI